MHTVDPAWNTLVLICSNCRGGRRGPDPRDVRKSLKKTLGKSKELRITEVDCLDLCPDDAVATCIVDVRTPGEATRCSLIGSQEDVEVLAQCLANKRAVNAKP